MRTDRHEIFAPAKPFFLGLFLGGLMVFLMLEGRAFAIWKAVTNPQAINGIQFKTEVMVKK